MSSTSLPMLKHTQPYRDSYSLHRTGCFVHWVKIGTLYYYNAENRACMTKKQISICMKDHKMLYEMSLSDPTTISQLKY